MSSYQIEIARRLLSASFLEFIRAAWPQLGQPEYVHGRHVEVLAAHLQAAARRDIRRLLINIPPSCSKSSIVSVLWPAWVWTWNPKASFLAQTYSQQLTLRDSAACRRLLETDWYQLRWPHLEFEADDNQKGYYRTTSGGWRLSTTRGGRATGEHPDFFLSDDPLSVEQASSKLEREAWQQWYGSTISTRGIAHDCVHVIAQQRLHPEDPSAVALEANKAAAAVGEPEPWLHVCLPMRFDPARAMRDRGYGGDWRREAGELLYPALLDEAKVRGLERDLGTRGTSAQLQQDPQHAVGQMFDVDRLLANKLSPDAIPKMDHVVRFWDRAATEGSGCHSAGVLLGFKGDSQVFVLDVVRGQWNPDQVLSKMSTCCIVDEGRYGGLDRVLTCIEQEPGSGGKESVINAIRRLKSHRVKAIPSMTNKVARAEPLANAIAFGEVFIVDGPWLYEFAEELRDFPAGRFKDQVDAASGAYLAGAGQIAKPQGGTVILGVTHGAPKLCSAPKCERPVGDGSEYCCSNCEVIASFEDGTTCQEHDTKCVTRYFDYQQRL
ncbi:MAG: phage terminase large subunit [Aureliella sp.]